MKYTFEHCYCLLLCIFKFIYHSKSVQFLSMFNSLKKINVLFLNVYITRCFEYYSSPLLLFLLKCQIYTNINITKEDLNKM